MSTDINRRIANGAGWMIGLSWVDRLIGVVSLAILARLLLPTDFGLVGYAMVFMTILDQFSMFNFQTVLIRDQDATPEQYNTVWTLDLIKGFALCTIIILGAEPVANFFDEPRVAGILYWTSAVPLLKGLINVGTVDFTKHLDFHKRFIFDVTVRFAGTMSTLVFAIVLRDYWALVYGSILRVILQVIISYVMSDFRPRLSLSGVRRVFAFSIWLLVHNISMCLYGQTPVIVIGRFFDAQNLAFFNIAKEFVNLTSNQFAAQIRTALFPGISKMQDDPRRMETTVTSALGVILLIGLPATIGIGLTAPLFVPLVLGDNWLEAVPVITVLSFSAAIGIYYPNSATLFLALNRPGINAAIAILRVSLLIPAILLVVPKYGAIGAAWTLLSVAGTTMIVDYVVLLRKTGMTLSLVIAAIWRSTLAVTIMAFCVNHIVKSPSIFAVEDSPILHLGASIASGALIYISVVWILWKIGGYPNGPEDFVRRTLQRFYHRTASLAFKH